MTQIERNIIVSFVVLAHFITQRDVLSRQQNSVKGKIKSIK